MHHAWLTAGSFLVVSALVSACSPASGPDAALLGGPCSPATYTRPDAGPTLQDGGPGLLCGTSTWANRMAVDISVGGASGAELYAIVACTAQADTVRVSAGRADFQNVGMEGALELGVACGFSSGGIYKGNGSALRLRSELSHLPKYGTSNVSLDDASDCSFCFEDGVSAGSFNCSGALSGGSRASIGGRFNCSQ